MRATTTLAQPDRASSSDLRLAIRAFLSVGESHGIAPGVEGNCHAHDLVTKWAQLTGQLMPVPVLRQELCRYLFGDWSDRRTEIARQRAVDEAVAVALLNGDVRLVPLPKRARR